MKGAYFHAFQTNSQIGHTCVGSQTLRWPRAPGSLNPSLWLVLIWERNNVFWRENGYMPGEKLDLESPAVPCFDVQKTQRAFAVLF